MVAIGLIVVLGVFDDDDPEVPHGDRHAHRPDDAARVARPRPAGPHAPARRAARGSAETAIVRYPTDNRFRLLIAAKGLPQPPDGTAYAVWLYTSADEKLFIGFPKATVNDKGDARRRRRPDPADAPLRRGPADARTRRAAQEAGSDRVARRARGAPAAGWRRRRPRRRRRPSPPPRPSRNRRRSAGMPAPAGKDAGPKAGSVAKIAGGRCHGCRFNGHWRSASSTSRRRRRWPSCRRPRPHQPVVWPASIALR